MKDDLIGTKAIAQQTPEHWSQAIAEAKLSKAWERFRRGLEEIRQRSERGSGGVWELIWRGSGKVEKGMEQL